ncbi:MAG: bifunctional diguanylate cyclase/phosphohydrolase [Bacillota bacterium]
MFNRMEPWLSPLPLHKGDMIDYEYRYGFLFRGMVAGITTVLGWWHTNGYGFSLAGALLVLLLLNVFYYLALRQCYRIRLIWSMRLLISLTMLLWVCYVTVLPGMLNLQAALLMAVLLELAMAQPGLMEFVLLGLGGHLAFVAAHWWREGNLLFYASKEFWATIIVVSFFYLGVLLVIRRTWWPERLLNQADNYAGFLNRKSFLQMAENKIQEAEKTGEELSLVHIDLHGLDEIAARYGVAMTEIFFRTIIQDNQRQRWGIMGRCGYQRLGLLVEGDYQQARNMVERFFQHLREKHQFFFGEEDVFAQAGLASYPQHGHAVFQLIDYADLALSYAGHQPWAIQVYHGLGDCCSNLSARRYIGHLQTLLNRIKDYDEELYWHSVNVAQYAAFLACLLGLPAPEVNRIRLTGLLHDLGKTSWSRELFLKTGNLTEKEWQEIKEHPQLGWQLITETTSWIPDEIRYGVLYHHENFDGKGYPKGLAGKNIPLVARIIAVADVYDALREERPYRPSKNLSEALRELNRMAYQRLDPYLVECFSQQINGLEKDLPRKLTTNTVEEWIRITFCHKSA